MRGLTGIERQLLVESCSTVDPTGDPGDDLPAAESAVYESLARRGCVRSRDIDLASGEEIYVWDITPRGRLALLCHQAVTAGMVSA